MVTPLTEGECRQLLASERRGHLAMTRRALPVVEDVEYGVVDGDVVLRTASDSWFGRALPGSVIALEAGQWDEGVGAGWSVLVQGEARLVEDGAERDSLAGLGLDAWSSDPAADTFVRVHLSSWRGHRTAREALEAAAVSTGSGS